ncbi:uncharacterized protein F4817DRAFT_369533 [Daldinia loculata]|uniref:uncharacterized protein n=1 Tax=Daldinia loculata TaxID=103429 RepID=UPI0020C5965B|nr:uncharacterized protein F4817DRAFT_369533 [Daldinia loculata]KAI1642319.1 hypothetical protein F4817DRAFT_369533 [Daldinia loculata]
MKTKRLSNHSRPPKAITQQSPDSGQSHQDDSMGLEDVLINAFSDSSYALSSPETVPNQDSASLGESEIATSLSFTKDDQESWIALDQLQRSPVIRAQQLNAAQNDPQIMYNDDVLLPNFQKFGHRSELTRCSCLQQHTRFLCHVKELDRTHDPHFIVITLDVANRCLRLWESHMSCQLCWEDEDHSALQLLLISIGTVVKRVWKFLTYQKQDNESIESLPNNGELAFSEVGVPKMASAGTEKASSEEPSGVNRSAQLRHDSKGPLITAPPMKITVDEFEVPEEEQMFIIGMLIIRMLTRIKEGLGDIRDRIKVEERSDEKGGNRNSWYPLHRLVPLILDNLDESVMELEQSLRNFIMP